VRARVCACVLRLCLSVFLDEIDAVGRARSSQKFSNDERESTLNQVCTMRCCRQHERSVLHSCWLNWTDLTCIRASSCWRAPIGPTCSIRSVRRANTIFFLIALVAGAVATGQIRSHSDDRLTRHSRTQTDLRDTFAAHHGDGRAQRARRVACRVDAGIQERDTCVRVSVCDSCEHSGADISNVCNEAALIAARGRASVVEMTHFEQAIERVVAGLAKQVCLRECVCVRVLAHMQNRVLSEAERRIVAVHESGYRESAYQVVCASTCMLACADTRLSDISYRTAIRC
jgi:SpoVK/Ycf46/Vps4 family AAA+-type ATPase